MIEKHVPRKDLCKKLYDLGVRMEAVFVWAKHKGEHKPRIEPRMRIHNMEFEEIEYTYPAPLASELGEVLPGRIRNLNTRNLDRLYFFKEHRGDDRKQDVRNGFTIEYWTHYFKPLARCGAETEPDARILMLIYLIEQNIVKVEDINGRKG